MKLLPYTGKYRPFSNNPTKQLYKIYHDGGHHIASLVNKKHITFKNTNIKKSPQNSFFQYIYTKALSKGLADTDLLEYIADKLIEQDPNITDLTNYIYDNIKCIELETKANSKKQTSTQTMLFDNFYFNAFKQNLKGAELKEYILNGMKTLYPDIETIPNFIDSNIKRVVSNMHKRKKRFKRKAYLNEWNYFVTFTYNNEIHTEETFKQKLRKCLSNLHTRRGWLYMGVFERAPETNRLHFHGIFYIPDGEMIGELKEVKDYDKHKGIMQTSYQNTFFTKNYGRNDFKELHIMGNTINYLLKYIGKTNERIVYSRGIPTEIVKEVDIKDIACEMIDFITKFVLFDNIIDWSRDIKKFKRKQLTIKDLMCNPPN